LKTKTESIKFYILFSDFYTVKAKVIILQLFLFFTTTVSFAQFNQPVAPGTAGKSTVLLLMKDEYDNPLPMGNGIVVDKNHKLIAFAIVMPSFSKALQKAKGKLFPFGIFYLLHARKYAKDVIFYLIGVHPDYQNKGVHAIIFDQYAKTFAKKGIENCIRTPELADNEAIKKIWLDFNPITHKKRSTYRLDI